MRYLLPGKTTTVKFIDPKDTRQKNRRAVVLGILIGGVVGLFAGVYSDSLYLLFMASLVTFGIVYGSLL